ncbi:MAG TPA: GNAT family protein [Xanthobacteraceae bacterium]|nr:GNAT family protein [Xanthobacteraceae bacterium]
MNEFPLGAEVVATPAERPGPVTLAGRHGAVARLDVARHGGDLWAAVCGHDELWTYMPSGPFADEASFLQWLKLRARDDSPYYFYSILDQNGRALGLAAMIDARPANRVVEIGHIVYGPALQRTALATEAQYLLARYVFETLRYRRYEWKCNALNAASRRAAERLGFVFEGIFRQHMIVKGRNRDTAWYSMLDSEWPPRKAAFERWLARENFDSQGRQKLRLEQCMS